MAAKKTIQKTKADDCPECVDRMITSEPPSVIAEKTSYQKPWVISGPVNFSDLNAKTALPPKSSAVEGPDYSDQMNLNAGPLETLAESIGQWERTSHFALTDNAQMSFQLTQLQSLKTGKNLMRIL
jgi:hypothetical protein